MQHEGSKPASKARERAGWAFACLGFLALLALPAIFQITHNHEALGWPTVSGLVVSSEVSESYSSESGDTWYSLDATYTYQVGARRLGGRSSLGPFSSFSRAREWAEAYPPGSRVSVHYDPVNPQRSAVWPEAHIRLTLVDLISTFLTPIAVFGLISLGLWVRAGVQRARRAPAAETKVLRRW